MMDSQINPITHAVFVEMVQAHVARDIYVRYDGGWYVSVMISNQRRTLVAKRGHARSFSSLDSVRNYMLRTGAKSFSVELY